MLVLVFVTSVDENLGVRQAAIRALQRVDPDWPRSERVQRLLPKLQATLKHKDASVQLAAAGLIQLVTRAQPQTLTLTPVAAPDAEKQKNTTLTRVLEELLRDPDSACRCAAAEAIAELKLALPVDFLALAELKHTTIEQIFLAAYDRELWFQRDCPDPDAIRQLLTEISRRALQLTTLLTLGDFRRLELRHAHARHLVVCGADRNLLVRAASPDSALATLPVPVAHDELPSWLQHEPSVRGALVRTIRFADASVVCDLDSRAFPVTQLETAFRRVHELFTLALPDGTRPDRLAWQFERAHLHCAVRADGALLGIFANSKDADLAGIENQLRQFTVAPIASRAAA